MTTMNCKLGRIATGVAAIVSMTMGISTAFAQDHSHAATTDQPAQEEKAPAITNANTLINVVRKATENYKDVKVAEAQGYALQFGCVTGSDDGAMGLHYVNMSLVNSGILDANRPHILIYEPMANGEKKLIGADYLLIADAWNAKYGAPPQLMGQLFHLFESPNRFGLPAFYTLHVWAWKNNPKGAYTNWHPNVSCQHFESK